MPLERCSAKITGRVQGVGFRAFTQKTALQYQLSGWVKNEHDGSVTLEAQGPSESLSAFKVAIEKGPVFSKVKQAHFECEVCLDDELDFRILR